MNILYCALVALLAALCGADTARAADPGSDEIERLRAQVEALMQLQQRTQNELDALRARVDQQGASGTSAAREPAEADSSLEALAPDDSPMPRIDFHGHVTVTYFGVEEQGSVSSGRSLSDFDAERSFSLSDLTVFTGVTVRDDLYVAAEIEYEEGGDEIEVDQAFLEYRLRADDPLAVRLGKFYVPFGIERFYQNSPRNALVDRPAPFIQIIPGTFSDTGIGLGGEQRVVDGPELIAEYEIALMNGLGASLFDSARDARQNLDNNSSKALASRIGARYDRWLFLGTSFLHGDSDDDDDDGFTALGADLRIDWAPFSFRSEYVYASLERGPDSTNTSGVSCASLMPGRCGDFHRRGWYSEATLRRRYDAPRLFRDVEYVLRYDVLDEDDEVRDLFDARRIATGVVLRPFDRLRLKVQYEITDEDRDELDNNAVLLEGSVNW
jgi:hypothetical protein